MEKINLVEILKDCPSGMELDCAMWGNVVLDYIIEGERYPIHIKKKDGGIEVLTENGCFDFDSGAKCIIFPKGTDTWEGFVPPYQFRDGDVIYVETDKNDWISIFKEIYNHGIITYVDFSLNGVLNGEFFGIDSRASCLCAMCDIKEKRIATEEEKNKLFEEIKNKGYKWNAEKKCLEKLEKDKFDINTLKPYESKVLVRAMINDTWKPAIFGCITDKSSCPFVTLGGVSWAQCIPFEGNEHLFNKTDDCDSYFKTWED